MNKFKLDTSSYVPLYEQLKQHLIHKIENNDWQADEKIYSETQLIDMFNVSRNTAKKAIEELEREGIVYRVQGRGTFVSQPKIEQSLTKFYSFSQVLEEQGLHPKDVILNVEIIKAPNKVASRLKINVDAEVVLIQRLRYANDEPIILETSYLPKKKIDDIKKFDQLGGARLYDILKESFDIQILSAKESFEPVLIREDEAEFLTVKKGSPALLLERIAYNQNKAPIEYCKSIVRGDRCKFYTELS